MDHSKAAHYNVTSFQLPGPFNLKAHSIRCLLINTTNDEYQLYTYNYQSGTYSLDPFSFTPLLNSTYFYYSQSYQWKISENCDRIKARDSYFFRNPSGNYASMNPSNFSALAVDSHL